MLRDIRVQREFYTDGFAVVTLTVDTGKICYVDTRNGRLEDL